MGKKFIVLMLALAVLMSGFSTTTIQAISDQSNAMQEQNDQNSDQQEEIDGRSIARYPAPDYMNVEKLSSLPTYNSNLPAAYQVDLRGQNLSHLDLSDKIDDLLFAYFDSNTIWPDKLAESFDPDKIMELGKDPGLDLKKLHEKGITGKGVGVAIIDQALLVNHIEYKDKLKVYEEINCLDEIAQMHGPAVASIAVGKTVGVAPEADLYYIAETHGTYTDNGFEWDFTWVAKSIDRVLEINKDLPEDSKIKVISISVGWNPNQKGYEEVMKAVETAKEQGVFVISSSLIDTHELYFNGMGRMPLNDPNELESYGAASMWERLLDEEISSQLLGSNSTLREDLVVGGNILFAPMDSRAVASSTGNEDYAFHRYGGWSWSIPYIAGVYALACQVNPEITPDEFWKLALETGDTMEVEYLDKEYQISKVVNPVKLIEEIDGRSIARYPAPAYIGGEELSSLPTYDPNSPAAWQVDLRGKNLSHLDLSDKIDDLMFADFDDNTIWSDKLSESFDPDKIMELGKDPGLDLKKLHEEGVTGKGIGIAIIDQALLVNHKEYKDQLKVYEEIHCLDEFAQMHGPAVASIAVGKTVGVAPEADLYYIAETHGTYTDNRFEWDFAWVAKSIDRILEINEDLPEDNKIKVISISVGWSPSQKGYEEVMQAVESAKEQGVFVISSSLRSTHKLYFNGMGRIPLNDPNELESYGSGLWWESYLDEDISSQLLGSTSTFRQDVIVGGNVLFVPMDSRAVASPTGNEDYVFYRNGGWSWSIPYIAGLYVLACQVNPEMTPDEFWKLALETGDTMEVEYLDKEYQISKVVNPVKLIEACKK